MLLHHLTLFISILTLASSLTLSGSPNSYSSFPPWSCAVNSSLSLDFNTIQPSGLLLYTDSKGQEDFFELKLSESSLRLRYNTGDGTQLITIGRSLNDGLWHKINIKRNESLTSLTLDDFVSQFRVGRGRDNEFSYKNNKSPVFIGGLPPYYNERLGLLSLPSVVFEPRFRGSIRNLIYENENGEFKIQEPEEAEGLITNTHTSQCELNSPCQHGSLCIQTEQGPLCDCQHSDFEGKYCEVAKKPPEAKFNGNEYLGYEFEQPIISTLDEVSLYFRSDSASGLLFYAGDHIDYLALTIREGRLILSVNLGGGPLDTRIHPAHIRVDDGHWHSIRVARKVQEITASLDSTYHDSWTLAGAFTMLSSNKLLVGGSPTPLIGLNSVNNYVGCVKKLEYRADTLKLGLIELAESGHRLVKIGGEVSFGCGEEVRERLASPAITFTKSEAYLTIRPPHHQKNSSISLQFRTIESNGLLLNSGQVSLSLFDGQIYLIVNGLRIQASNNPINNGDWHEIRLRKSNSRQGSISVDGLVTDFNSDLAFSFDYLTLGGGNLNQKHSKNVWASQLNHGFVGCTRNLLINNVEIDLVRLAGVQDSSSIRPMCQYTKPACPSSPCQNNGVCREGWNRVICDCLYINFEGVKCEKASPSAEFKGSHFINVQLPEKESDVEEILIRFRTGRPTGLLLQLISDTDYIQIAVEFTRIKSIVKFAGIEKSLTSHQSTPVLNDNSYHTIVFKRHSNLISLRVDQSPITRTELNSRNPTFRPKSLIIGSGNDFIPLHGEINKLLINNVDIFKSIINKKLNGVNNVKFVVQEFNFKPVQFAGSFIGLEQLKAYSSMDLGFNIKTSSESGLIFYNGGKSDDFISLELFNGKLIYSVELGDGLIKLESPNPINDDNWHNVYIWREFNRHSLVTDGESVSTTDANAVNMNLDLNGVFYMAGLPGNIYPTLHSSIKAKEGFVGCIASLEISGELIDIQDSLIVPGSFKTGCESCKCQNGGKCSSVCDCSMTTFTGPTCTELAKTFNFRNGLVLYKHENKPDTRQDSIAFAIATKNHNGTLIYINSDISEDFILIEVLNGKLLATFNVGTANISVGSEYALNDGQFHIVKFWRGPGGNGSLQIDGSDLVHATPGGPQTTIFNRQSEIHVGGRWSSFFKRILDPYQGLIRGLSVNGLRPLELGRSQSTHYIGDLNQESERQNDHYQVNYVEERMQKTPPSIHSNALNDDLVHSATGPCPDDEDDCVPLFDTGSGDDLVTPVYIPAITTKRPTTTSSDSICDDEEDCGEFGSGLPPRRRRPTSTQNWDVTTVIGPDGRIDLSTIWDERSTSTGSESTSHLPVSSTDPQGPPVQVSTSTTTTTPSPSTTTTIKTPTSSRFIPPPTPTHFLYPIGRVFDFPGQETATTAKPIEKTVLAESSDSTLIIVIIIALLLIIIVSILIIFFMCKRRDDPIYKVEEKSTTRGGYEFVGHQGHQQQVGQGQQGRQRKQGVKEWYV